MLDLDRRQSLRTVWDHAKVNLKDAATRNIQNLILKQKLPLQARVLRYYSSQHAYQFPINQLPLKEKADPPAKEAYRYAYGAPLPQDGTVVVIRKQQSISVWTGIHVENVFEDGEVDLGNIARLDIDFWNSSLKLVYLSEVRLTTPSGSHYFLGEELRYVEAEGVSCRQQDADTFFPYATEFPARRVRGRPPLFSPDEITALLQEIDRDGKQKPALIMNKIADHFAAKGGAVPSYSAMRSWIRKHRMRNK